MNGSLNSNAEIRAKDATKLPSFPINLEEVKRTTSQILSTFGKNHIFAEYTTHDISHIDDMLATIDWLIPDETKAILSPGEWLLLVLSIYFHDLGLIVTADEYTNRSLSDVDKFRDEQLYSSADYKAKIVAQDADVLDRFIYQEFVRANHGKRVRAWIEGKAETELGFASAQVAEMNRLLTPLDKDFRRDLAMVCESHSLDDLEDIKKYRLSHPYGNSDDETVNLQYIAILLRTIDLLQITRQRAPSVLYRLINPTDPISQVEWIKQNGVKRVRSKIGVDREGNASSDASSDTIEVYASFSDDNGFFGLTSYLHYAAEQLNTSFGHAQKSAKHTPKKYLFPWRYIDDSNVDAEGFLKQTFGFEIDQEKILDLLTGHTLYNDSSIVLRELTQNAIDAVRLQYLNSSDGPEKRGKISIEWNTSSSQLSVTDNGTGMSQDIIEKHLLKVGSSRYQDPKFKESNPGFSPISRFGIGVLSAFMVADSVEIITVTPDEENGRQISLRSVHGKYLIRLLDKKVDSRISEIGAHGTRFVLKFRPSARKLDVLEAMRAWIKFPRCKVEVTIDGQKAENVGYHGPKEALEAYLASPSAQRLLGKGNLKVVDRKIGGFTIAFVLQYNSHYRDWNLTGRPEGLRARDPDTVAPPIATCIEGVAVEFDIPGFKGTSILAVVNVEGSEAPKTNVARSALEQTDERARLVVTTYEVLFDSITAESRRLVDEEKYSLTWAIGQMPFLLSGLSSGRGQIQNIKAFNTAIEKVPLFLVDEATGRSAKSIEQLSSLGSFWTVESHLAKSSENFIKEAKSELTVTQLLGAIASSSTQLPSPAIVTNSHDAPLLQNVVNSRFQISNFNGQLSERRLDIKWVNGNGAWLDKESLRRKLSLLGSTNEYVFLDRTRELAEGRSNSIFFKCICPHWAHSSPGT